MFKVKISNVNEKIKGAIESVTDSIDNVSMPVSTTKIAITGLSRSGKTVFITSLIDQLIYQKNITFLTSNHKPFKVSLKPPKAHIKRFDYYPFSKDIKTNSKWPDGTDSITSTILEFETKSRFSVLKNKIFRVELIDYPGEWILDIAMLGFSYEQWSENVIHWMENINDDLVKQYLHTIKDLSEAGFGVDQELELHHQYVSMLKHLKKKHYSNITPGRFIMPSDLAEDPLLIFAPIHKSDSALHKIFKKRYENYLKEIVKDIHLEYFKDFDRQIVLVDVIEALQNGYQCYKNMQDGLQSMLSLYDHRNKNFISQWFSPSINKVSFLATKADLIASSQHNNYSALLNEMVDEIKHGLDIKHIETDAQVVAAVQCTQTVEKRHEGKVLSFIRGIVAKENKTYDIYPGEMPSSFPIPDSWDSRNYDFEEFLPPKKTYKENEPFYHINMDRVIDSVIGDLL